MPKIFTPTNQLKLTNVAVVRLKKTGKRFEIACYRNKVMAWRNNTETDIDEVLQTHTIFLNVSKGQFAKKEDLVKAFGNLDDTSICKEILLKGELQVSDKERESVLESQFKQIAYEVSTMCVNPNNDYPYPPVVIETAMKNAHYSIKPHHNIKQQALAVIKLLKESIPIERAQIKLTISFSNNEGAKFAEKFGQIKSLKVEDEIKTDYSHTYVVLVEPQHFKQVEEIGKKEGCLLDVISNRELGNASTDLMN
ncbi:hypothetical protein RI129_005827 [Pyrocoelia pectoralis]|uniref:Ribosome maturation protein SBDS n=1 Tax=Pyrocoelia pectoralis TaxID=417401 RepID=A0AAN7ZJ94_9COLE